ncbi:MAG TPA: FMN-binding negative transcriptional regulator [Casimicrobium sp.]|nr:FMN-binding negative transcriptional regulator [Casimicrobium sp.]
MYIPKQFESPSHALTLDVMRTHDFAMLISSDADGLPIATPLPVVVSEVPSVSDDSTQTQVILHFHLTRANPHVALLRDGRPTMVAFSGPNAYMSPSVYADLKRVPTWNYIAVHAYGAVEEVTSAEDKDALLKSLISIHEPDYAAQWKGLDHEFQHAMLGAIAGFRMTVTRLDSKFKINQHRKEAHAQMKAAYVTGSPDEQALAQWMTRLGL